ncbi:hypothetical protein H6S82_15560 [Planktothrix sp. FACHB-1355]|uniref:hypothetical protein n=1 Tax=Planktothrix sp. FACHB-1355 TaxID=2692854 RepID=UPI00168B8084|nr:hypothetical protein [Planktothrix sp. FACHB-1355]MBD3560259.1 hypothetical protein [Planktothrix sp. FACHB-1355]
MGYQYTGNLYDVNKPDATTFDTEWNENFQTFLSDSKKTKSPILDSSLKNYKITKDELAKTVKDDLYNDFQAIPSLASRNFDQDLTAFTKSLGSSGSSDVDEIIFLIDGGTDKTTKINDFKAFVIVKDELKKLAVDEAFQLYYTYAKSSSNDQSSLSAFLDKFHTFTNNATPPSNPSNSDIILEVAKKIYEDYKYSGKLYDVKKPDTTTFDTWTNQFESFLSDAAKTFQTPGSASDDRSLPSDDDITTKDDLLSLLKGESSQQPTTDSLNEALDLYNIYANNTTDATKKGFGDFITNFHDFISKFQLHSIATATTLNSTQLGYYNDLETRVNVDQSKSDESVIIADAMSEAVDLKQLTEAVGLFGLTGPYDTTNYNNWVKLTDIIYEANTKGIDKSGKLVAEWWTDDHLNLLKDAEVQKLNNDSLAQVLDLYGIYAKNTTTGDTGFRDFISDFHNFLKFQLPSTNSNDYNDLKAQLDVDQSKSDNSVIIADAQLEVTRLEALLNLKESDLLTKYKEWMKPTDIINEAKTQGINNGNFVAEWWTDHHLKLWKYAAKTTDALNKLDGVLDLKHTLSQVYTTNTTDATQTKDATHNGDFTSNFHDFMKFKIESIYNALEKGVDVDQSKSDNHEVMIADAQTEVVDLFGLGKTSTKLKAEYADWVKPADIIYEAKTKGIDDGNLVVDWWTPAHWKSWSQAYLNKYKGEPIFWKHEGMQLEEGINLDGDKLVFVNGAVDEKTNDTIADKEGNVVWIPTGHPEKTQIFDKQRNNERNVVIEEGAKWEDIENYINDSNHTEEVRAVQTKFAYEFLKSIWQRTHELGIWGNEAVAEAVAVDDGYPSDFDVEAKWKIEARSAGGDILSDLGGVEIGGQFYWGSEDMDPYQRAYKEMEWNNNWNLFAGTGNPLTVVADLVLGAHWHADPIHAMFDAITFGITAAGGDTYEEIPWWDEDYSLTQDKQLLSPALNAATAIIQLA